jgi:pimeloyl-ACP methyl ester carboxylesterase
VIEDRIKIFTSRTAGGISYRESGIGPALVMLHGIGGSSAAWLFQLEGIEQFRVIAWEAPGYGKSTPLKKAEPLAADYAQALHAFADSLELRDFTLVANSLGGLMAAAYARAHPERVRGIVMISPAGGHGGDRVKLAERLKQLDELGPEGMAEKRSPTLLGRKAPPIALELVQWSQRHINPPGYRQAAHCLAMGKLVDDAKSFDRPVLVFCGSEDVITPEAGCKAIAKAYPHGEYRSLPGIGHQAQIEDPTTINAAIASFSS